MKKKLTEQIIDDTESEVILMLLSCYEQEEARGSYRWNANNGYYGEAFGIFRCLTMLGYTFFGATNKPVMKENARWWFSECKHEAEKIVAEIGIEKAIRLYQSKCSEISQRSRDTFIKFF